MAENDSLIRLLHFRSGTKDYAMNLGYVKEIIRMVALKEVSELPAFVRGIINMRGETLPVIDFLSRSGAGLLTPVHLKTRIVILKVKSVTIGLLVDEVKETFEINENDISKNILPDVVIDPKYILGTFLYNDNMTIWVDVERFFTSSEFNQLEQGGIHA